MKLRATEAGVWPAGTSWSIGKVRDIELPSDAELPSWLVEVKQPKAKAKRAKVAAQADEG